MLLHQFTRIFSIIFLFVRCHIVPFTGQKFVSFIFPSVVFLRPQIYDVLNISSDMGSHGQNLCCLIYAVLMLLGLGNTIFADASFLYKEARNVHVQLAFCVYAYSCYRLVGSAYLVQIMRCRSKANDKLYEELKQISTSFVVIPSILHRQVKADGFAPWSFVISIGLILKSASFCSFLWLLFWYAILLIV